MNSTKNHPTDAYRKRCAFTGYRTSKMPFGTNEDDLRCVDFKQWIYLQPKSLLN